MLLKVNYIEEKFSLLGNVIIKEYLREKNVNLEILLLYFKKFYSGQIFYLNP